jgi:hypothetical protein
MRSDTLSSKELTKPNFIYEQYIDLGDSDINKSNKISIYVYTNPSNYSIYISSCIPLVIITKGNSDITKI